MRFTVCIIVSLIVFQSCNTNKVAKSSNIENEVQQFVGTWEGEETEQFGTKKSWIQKRYKDGRYEITILVSTLSEIVSINEKGTWWLTNGMFYEKNEESMKEPDIYKYEFLLNDEIRFTSVSMDTSSGLEQYSFVDRRKK